MVKKPTSESVPVAVSLTELWKLTLADTSSVAEAVSRMMPINSN
jgi:hypothetical protein